MACMQSAFRAIDHATPLQKSVQVEQSLLKIIHNTRTNCWKLVHCAQTFMEERQFSAVSAELEALDPLELKEMSECGGRVTALRDRKIDLDGWMNACTLHTTRQLLHDEGQPALKDRWMSSNGGSACRGQVWLAD